MCTKMSKLGAGPATLTDSLIIHCALRHISFVIPVPLRRQGHTKMRHDCAYLCRFRFHWFNSYKTLGSDELFARTLKRLTVNLEMEKKNKTYTINLTQSFKMFVGIYFHL